METKCPVLFLSIEKWFGKVSTYMRTMMLTKGNELKKKEKLFILISVYTVSVQETKEKFIENKNHTVTDTALDQKHCHQCVHHRSVHTRHYDHLSHVQSLPCIPLQHSIPTILVYPKIYSYTVTYTSGQEKVKPEVQVPCCKIMVGTKENILFHFISTAGKHLSLRLLKVFKSNSTYELFWSNYVFKIMFQKSFHCLNKARNIHWHKQESIYIKTIDYIFA